ncbi:uncharacterized protein LOC131642624 [Vicia villosa]|uniref:uncharacterized protein LOC131642624 n=1 Tax=Vicia villosa TaxID=3911 RepID=UPI00273AFF34|nr:uncharacterized protein LOC131642624 [Vicia villosa]
MGRGWPRKTAARTPLAVVHVFTPSSSSHTGSSGNTQRKLDTTETITQVPVLKPIVEEQIPQVSTDATPSIVNGEVEVSIETQDIESELQYWEDALVMYVIGEDLSMNAVRKFMTSTWNFVSLPELYYNNEGYFIIRFNLKSDRDMVLRRGPYTINRKPMFLHEWKPDFTMKEDMIRTLPLWVIFPHLPLVYWGEKSIGKIASALGKPITTDECTTKKLRVSYARALIEIDVTRELKTYINIRGPGGDLIKQDVDYEWRPPFCSKCNQMGHECKNIIKKGPDKAEKRWEPKPTQQVIEKEEDKDVTQEQPPEPVPNESPRDWIEVKSSNKGKGVDTGLGSSTVDCQNIFAILGGTSLGD